MYGRDIVKVKGGLTIEGGKQKRGTQLLFLDAAGEVVDAVAEVGFGFIHLLDLGEGVDNR